MSYLELLDYRRQMADLFADLRRRSPGPEALAWFRARKDRLFAEHPQSPLPAEARALFKMLPYWPFDAEARVVASFTADPEHTAAHATADGEPELVRIGRLEFQMGGAACELAAFWIPGYGGGLFVPFRDATSGKETYGGGRYLIDSIKSADLGSDFQTGTVVLDFNYAYHPSCAYAPLWRCPLAPPSNHLAIAVRAGERL